MNYKLVFKFIIALFFSRQTVNGIKGQTHHLTSSTTHYCVFYFVAVEGQLLGLFPSAVSLIWSPHRPCDDVPERKVCLIRTCPHSCLQLWRAHWNIVTSMASFQHTSGLPQPPQHTAAVVQALEYVFVFSLNCLSLLFLLFIQNFISFTDSLNRVSKSKPEKAI